MTPTLEAVEQLANQLSEQDQKALLQRLGMNLHVFSPDAPVKTSEQSVDHAKQVQLARQILAEVEGLPDDEPGMLDVTEEIRRMREERHR